MSKFAPESEDDLPDFDISALRNPKEAVKATRAKKTDRSRFGENVTNIPRPRRNDQEASPPPEAVRPESDLDELAPEFKEQFCSKPEHSKIPMISYGERRWCRFCEANRHKSTQILRTFILMCHWGIVLSLPLLILGLSTVAPLTHDKTGGLQRSHYLSLVLPASFLTVCIVSCGLHFWLRRKDQLASGALGVSKWYSPNHMMKDWIVTGLAFGIPYLMLLRFGEDLLGSGSTFAEYIRHRASVMIILSCILLPALNTYRIITPHTLFPERRSAMAILQFGVLTSVGFLPIHLALSQFVQSRPSMNWLYVPLALTLFFLLLFVGATAMTTLMAKQIKGLAQLPLPAKVAMIGPSNVGKTVFLTRAYHLMENSLHRNMTITPTNKSRRRLNPIKHRLNNLRQWPLPTHSREVNTIPFIFKRGDLPLAIFHWMDLPGEAFTDPTKFTEARKAFEVHLTNCDAVVMMFDAEDLKEAPPIPFMSIYKEVAELLHERLRDVGPGARAVPLAIIITKSSLVPAWYHQRIQQMFTELANYWQFLSRQANLGKAEVAIFLASAVVTPYQEDRVGKPAVPTLAEARELESVNCQEPIYWLAAKILRENLGIMDSIVGFATGSVIQDTVIQLEMLAKK